MTTAVNEEQLMEENFNQEDYAGMNDDLHDLKIIDTYEVGDN